MAFDFPNAPAVDEVFTPPGGPSYKWNGTGWYPSGSAAAIPPGTHIGDAPPATPTVGQLWWDSDKGNLYVWYDDGTSAQWVPSTGASGGGGGLADAPSDGVQYARQDAAWTAVAAGGGGGPLPGVTDGSDAAAGMIGEVWFWQGELTWNGTYYAMLSSGAIPAGDWDVYINTAGNVEATTAKLHWTINEVYPNNIINMSTSNGGSLLVFMGTVYPTNWTKGFSPAYRLSVSVPTALTGSVTAYSSSGGTVNQTAVSIGIAIWARRAR